MEAGLILAAKTVGVALLVIFVIVIGMILESADSGKSEKLNCDPGNKLDDDDDAYNSPYDAYGTYNNHT